MRKLALLFVLLVMAVVGGLVLGGTFLWGRITEPYKGYAAPEMFVHVTPGSTATDIRRGLVEGGVVRDDLTALNFAVACYQMLHTTALAMHDQPLADLALRHIKDFTPEIMDLSEVLPSVVLCDLEREKKISADESVAEEARKNTREAWMQGASVH